MLNLNLHKTTIVKLDSWNNIFAKLIPSQYPTQLGAELVIFPNNPATQPSTPPPIQALDDLDLKGKVVSLNG